MNRDVMLTLDEAVAEVLGQLTGLDLTYDPELERYRAVTRKLNRALRDIALEKDWSYYCQISNLGAGGCSAGSASYTLPYGLRPRITGDDAVRLKDGYGSILRWAYVLPRDALHKYRNLEGLWVAAEGSRILFSRPLTEMEAQLEIELATVREPRMFRLPAAGTEVPASIRNQPVDFDYPDLVVARASYLYAQSDPVLQPRVPTLEQDYKNLMYQLLERDSSHTDTPYQNEFDLGLSNGLVDVVVRDVRPHSNFD